MFLDRQPKALHFVKEQMKRFDRANVEAGEAKVEIETALCQEPAGGSCFGDALLTQIRLSPSGEALLEVPLGLGMAEKG